MNYFVNDYSEGAAPEILEKLLQSNFSKQSGYGNDEFCLSAREKIKAAMKSDAARMSMCIFRRSRVPFPPVSVKRR